MLTTGADVVSLEELTDAGGRRHGSMGDYESFHGLLEALERRVAQDGPWWTDRPAGGPGNS